MTQQDRSSRTTSAGPRIALICAAACLSLIALGCGGGVQSVAEQNRTFYTAETLNPELRAQLEQRYPPLDAKMPVAEYLGYRVLNGRVRISRPTDWALRKVSDDPGRRFIQYVSPHEYTFNIYEWPDNAEVPWNKVIARYEDETKEEKAELLEKRIPVGSFGSQGRAYLVRRKVPAAKSPYVSISHEFLARGDRRIVLVQVVHQGDSLTPDMEELRRVLETIEVD